MSYLISSRDYLRRAEKCLEEQDRRFLFYAAFELRCGVESRHQEHLEAWDHIPSQKKNRWELNILGKTSKKFFATEDKIMRCEFRDNYDEVFAILYYTPVTSKLTNEAEKLGNYLHAMKQFRKESDTWWNEFRCSLDNILNELKVSVTGTLLGPALIMGNKQIVVTAEIPPEVDQSVIDKIGSVGDMTKIKVTYLDSLPHKFEERAIVWKV